VPFFGHSGEFARRPVIDLERGVLAIAGGVVVVSEAGQRQVAGDGPATVLLGDYIVNLKRELVVDVRHPALFTTVASARQR
jgi:hypothetical protein